MAYNWEDPFKGTNSAIPETPPNEPETPGPGPASPGQTQNNIPCAPGYEKKLNSAGTAEECVPIGTGPAQGPCAVAGTSTIDIDASGRKKSAPDNECVDAAEASRRNKLWIQQNPGNAGEGNTGTAGGTSTTGTPGAQKYTPTKSPYDSATSKAIYEMLMGIMNGTDLPFGPETIAKMQASALQSNKAQLSNSRDDVQKRLINSGLSRSGIAPATYGKLESAASADFSNNLRQIATTAVQQNYNARMSALQEAQKFLQSERANSLSQDQMLLSYARLNQEWQSMQAGFSQQWKIVQNGNEQAMMQLMLCLRTGTGC